MTSLADHAATNLVADVCLLTSHVLQNPHREYTSGLYYDKFVGAMLDALLVHKDIDRESLTAMVAWVCWHLSRRGLLTTEDHDVLAAAWRLSDAIHPVPYRVRYQPRFLGSDGTTD